MFDERHLEMGVGAGVAVPREVLAAGGDAGALQRADDRRAEPRDILGAFGQGRSPITGFLGLVRTSSTGV